MKTLFVLASLALSALAQSATIISPADGSTVTSGETIVVDVQQENSSSDLVEVAVVLGLQFCPSNDCAAVTPGQPGVGTVLFSGPFAPVHDPAPPFSFHQNFTVEMPEFLTPGSQMILTLTHLQLVGAVKVAVLEQSGIVLNIE
ncbi:uncharacterized protein BXZ73DRAFT_101844 [Epithele typhae]|uniref:uncharacterized protein n=1 Tax=Epithele typhae TaxID=378194 RepID=UPI002007B15F|nr:uncharacterized protein BXZ73DRAFT_101844 [Epithele typhae]KAH9930471.1 hypothetical protein BXZ73DRAFT_101844 [Epithele typhae]